MPPSSSSCIASIWRLSPYLEASFTSKSSAPDACSAHEATLKLWLSLASSLPTPSRSASTSGARFICCSSFEPFSSPPSSARFSSPPPSSSSSMSMFVASLMTSSRFKKTSSSSSKSRRSSSSSSSPSPPPLFLRLAAASASRCVSVMCDSVAYTSPCRYSTFLEYTHAEPCMTMAACAKFMTFLFSASVASSSLFFASSAMTGLSFSSTTNSKFIAATWSR